MTIFDGIIWATKISSIVVLGTVGLLVFTGRPIHRQRWAVLALFTVQIGSLVAYYAAWWHRLASNPMTQALLWPKSDYLFRHLTTDMTSLVAGWVAGAVLLGLLVWMFLRRGHGRMLDGTDVGLLFFMSVAVGWPSIFIALAMVFGLSVLTMIVLVIIRKKTLQDRLVISPVIIPATILTLVFQEQLLNLTRLGRIGF